MAEADATSILGRIAGGRVQRRREIYRPIAFAKDRLRADIVAGRVTLGGENKTSLFDLPSGSGASPRRFAGRRKGDRWCEPVRTNPLAGKSAPAGTRTPVVADREGGPMRSLQSIEATSGGRQVRLESEAAAGGVEQAQDTEDDRAHIIAIPGPVATMGG